MPGCQARAQASVLRWSCVWHWFVASSWGVAFLLSSASPAVVRHGQLGRGYRAAVRCRLAKVIDLWLLRG